MVTATLGQGVENLTLLWTTTLKYSTVFPKNILKAELNLYCCCARRVVMKHIFLQKLGEVLQYVRLVCAAAM